MIRLPSESSGVEDPAENLEMVRLFPFSDDDATIANLQKELHTYLAEAEGVNMDEGK